MLRTTQLAVDCLVTVNKYTKRCICFILHLVKLSYFRNSEINEPMEQDSNDDE